MDSTKTRKYGKLRALSQTKGGESMRLRELHVEILECVLVIISIGQLGKAVSWLLSPLIVRLLDMLPGGAV